MKRFLGIFIIVATIFILNVSVAAAVGCGTRLNIANPQTCECINPAGQTQMEVLSPTEVCCGWKDGNNCSATDPAPPQISCGDTFFAPYQCNCLNSSGQQEPPKLMDNGGYCCGWYDKSYPGDTCRSSPSSSACGTTVVLNPGESPSQQCACAGTDWFVANQNSSSKTMCCGWFSPALENKCSTVKVANPRCFATAGCGYCDNPGEYCKIGTGDATCVIEPGQCGQPQTPAPTPSPVNTPTPASSPVNSPIPTATPDPVEDPVPTPPLNIFDGPSSADFAALNPLRIFESPYADQFSSPAGIINRALIFIYPLAGLILFVMIVWGGFEMVIGATNSKSKEAGRQRITAALMGFGLLFASFWIIQIVEYIFNIAIL